MRAGRAPAAFPDRPTKVYPGSVTTNLAQNVRDIVEFLIEIVACIFKIHGSGAARSIKSVSARFSTLASPGPIASSNRA